LEKTITYNTSNLLTTVTGPFGQALGLQYNALNQVTTMTVPDGNVFNYSYNQYYNLTCAWRIRNSARIDSIRWSCLNSRT